jgi:hypothetical protein
MAAHAFTSEEMVTQLRALAHAGHPASNIARVLNARFNSTLTPQAVRVKCCALGIRLRPRKAKTEIRFNAEPFTWRYLEAEAFRRGTTLTRFLRLFMRIVAADNLVPAILDDAGPQRPSRDAHEAGAAFADALAAQHPEKRNGVARP